VEDAKIGGSDNASIWNFDGSLRCRPKNPFEKESGISFYYSEYIKSKLHIVLAGSDRDFGVFVDENTCSLYNQHEAR